MKPPSGLGEGRVEDMTAAEVRELAEAYLDLLRSMRQSLEECTTGYIFISWSGRGFNIDGHPPADLVDAIRTGPTRPTEPTRVE